ncbi:MAG: S-layer homology domain-containing protein [Oscillospiraceae bacterium]|nr:S-layer homology domain-containing protein [Oscillospiraceae bacterium]
MKRTISLLLALILCLGLLTGFASAADFPFADVPIYEWYFEDVKNAYDMGLINGKTLNLFAPNDYLTYAEAVKLAACMNERYQKGAVTLTNGDPWYQSYVDYCKEEKIIDKDYSWNANATRAGYMEIFANALPEKALAEINRIEAGAIPDVAMSHPQAEAIYKLYCAGILQGNDAAHNCSPAANIKRSEVSAILTRMMDASERIRFAMDGGTVTEPESEEETVKELKIKEQPKSISGKSGDEVILEVWIEGGTLPYTYTWLVGNDNNAGIINGLDGTWVSGGSLSESGSFFSKLHITLPSQNLIDDSIFCVIEDSAGKSVSTDKVTVTMVQDSTPLKIQSSPDDVTVLPGETAELSIAVTGGTKPYKYSWEQYDGKIWKAAGETADTLMVKIPPAYSGSGQNYRCVITDAAGQSLTSDVARVSVDARAPLTVTDSRMAAGDLVELYVFPEGGTAPYTYRWQGYSNMSPTDVTGWKGVTVVNLDTSSSLTVNTEKCSCTKFHCIVRDANGETQTIEFTIG